jgi:hypothetical protein
MFVKAIGHFLEREAHVFEADLLADDIERHGRKTIVHRTHHPREYGAVARTGVEQAQRRRTRFDLFELDADAIGDDPLFVAGVHEQQIFLPIVVETKMLLPVEATARGRHGGANARPFALRPD